MKIIDKILLLACVLIMSQGAQAQKGFAEATIVYDMVIQSGNAAAQKSAFNDATTTVYLKGKNSRTEMASALGNEITIFNSKTDNAIILKEFSGQKLMITLTKENWKSKNRQYSDIKFELTDEYKTIGGYNARKAVARMSDGKTFDVYYAPGMVPANKDYDATFTNLPGLALEYEIETGRMKFKYSLSKISFDVVQASLFDFPNSGYRVMSYEENQKLKKGN